MIAYLDLPSGISGDMFLSCLVDAGWPIEELQAAVARLDVPAEEFSIGVESVLKGPLRATRVKVDVIESRQKRNLDDIHAILDRSDLPAAVKQRARDVFHNLATAEAKVHGMSIDQVHFHEVGAVDAIVDVVGVCCGIEALKIERLYASPLPVGAGWVISAHGPLPLPAPATLEILAAKGAPIRPAPGEGELVTPTGAALVATLATFAQPAMTLRTIATGAGFKDFRWPNVARLWLGEASDTPATPHLVQIDTNIDDMNPQLYPGVIDGLLAAGAADAWLTPVQMKKGRPGTVVSALASPTREIEIAEYLLKNTTTLGVRVHAVHRHEAGRERCEVATRFGPVGMKVKMLEGRVAGATPEFEECRRLAEQAGVSVADVQRAAAAAFDSLSVAGLSG
jgi:uncharacterized protein (TIGR00299 family) protein